MSKRRKEAIKGWCNIKIIKGMLDKDPNNTMLRDRYEYLKKWNKLKPNKDAMNYAVLSGYETAK